jgi:CMP-N,N'-diacetyllegionaminic acid synthase
MKPNILTIIPARAGSKGVPDKNARLLAGKPLIQYTIESALRSKALSSILLSSDSEKIIALAKQYPRVETPFTRPAELALDSTPMILVVQHALAHYNATGQSFDYICLLQPTTPFRKSDLIDQAIEQIIHSKADSLTTIQKVPHRYNPHWTFKIEDEQLHVTTGEKEIIPRRQALPEAWYRDGQLYITRTELVRKGTLTGGKFIGYRNDGGSAINIDTPEDWNDAENFAANEAGK